MPISDKLGKRACCAPLPREINNYYNRSHNKKKDESECKGSCYCKSSTCHCSYKGLSGQFANINTCQCCTTSYPSPKENSKPVNTKSTCSKCKRPKRQRSSSPPPRANKPTNACRHCSPQRLKSPTPKPTNVCKCLKNDTNLPNQKQHPSRFPKQNTIVDQNKRYTWFYKPYEKGDSILELPSTGVTTPSMDYEESNNHRLEHCCEGKQIDVKELNGKVCTCGLMKPCDSCLKGMWCKEGGVNEAAPPCRRCGHKVYAAEKLVASGGAFHTSCFSCYGCHKALEVTNLYESHGEIYCKQCYAKYFGMSGYGYGTTLLSPI